MYDIDFGKKGEILVHKRKFILFPELWEDTTTHNNSTLQWNFCKFNSDNKGSVSSKKGVYCFVVKPNVPNFIETAYLFYVGETTRPLKTRFSEYLNDQAGKGKPRPKVFEMLKLYKDYIYFYFTEIDNDADIHKVEDNLINTFIPFINTKVTLVKVNPEYRNIYES